MADETKDQDTSVTKSLKTSRKIYTNSKGETVDWSWGYHNEPIESYEDTFQHVLEGKKISDLLAGKEDPIVIDLMGAPRTTHDLLSEFPMGRGLAVSLADHDPDKFNEYFRNFYKSEKVTWLDKDITKPEAWRSIETWLDGKQADLIMERAIAGLELLPAHKKMYGILLNQAWKNLSNNNGVLLFETPRRDELMQNGINLDTWAENLKSVVEVKYDPGRPEDKLVRYRGANFMLIKTSSSPPTLPSI